MNSNTTQRSLTPLLKWPGGKRLLIDSLVRHIPNNINRYYEAFFGGGALFFAHRPANSVINDLNADLMDCYVQIRDNVDEVLGYLAGMHNSEEEYYEIRRSSPTVPAEKAARLTYLVTLSFNGIYRQNLNGEFNVPYGHRPNKDVLNEIHIRQISNALSGVEIRSGDFALSVRDAAHGDFIYFDPPYTVAHSNNGFVKYNAKIFSWLDQQRLADTALELSNRGCVVVVSNADHESIDALYPTFTKATVMRGSVMAATSQHRGPITEAIFISGEVPNA